MICDVCKGRNASVRVKKMVSGRLTDHFLCAECAIRFGYAKTIHPFYDIDPQPEAMLRCPCCGCSIQEITEMGMAGCASCYDTFRDRMLVNIEKIHGKVSYAGWVPPSSSLRIQNEKRIAEARAELAEAIEREDFERAAELRDLIHAIQNTPQGGTAL